MLDRSPREQAPVPNGHPFDAEGRLETIVGLEISGFQTIQLCARDQQNDFISQLCEGLANFHHLNAVGCFRWNLRRRNAYHSHVLIKS
jgi:hypothetical protein